MSDGQLFRIVSHGIRTTGMPAFGPKHNQEDIWNIVAVVRQPGSLSEAESRELQEAAKAGGH